jgi:hypothetical protein
MALYAADGSINITVVDGSTYTGVYAEDGSLNVVVSDGSQLVGAHHPCGALWVTVSDGDFSPIRAADGSLYITEDTSLHNSGLRVTVVAGDLDESDNNEYFIFDTDMATDCDDMFALGLLLTYIQQTPTAHLLAGITSSPVEKAAPALKAALEAYGFTDVPVGAYEGSIGPTRSFYASNQAYVWGHGDETRADYPTASTVYRQVLSDLPEGAKAKVIVVGMLGALYEFVQSGDGADGIPGTGAEIFGDKILRIYNQGPNYANSTPRYNWEQNEPAAKYMAENATTLGVPWTILPTDEADSIYCGPPADWDEFTDPIKRAYDRSYTQLTSNRRPSWDPLAVWAAIFPDDPAFSFQLENASVAYNTTTNLVTKGAADSGVISWLNVDSDTAGIGAAMEAYIDNLTPAVAPIGDPYLEFELLFTDQTDTAGAEVTLSGDAVITGGNLDLPSGNSYAALPGVGGFSSHDWTLQLRDVTFDTLATAAKNVIGMWAASPSRMWVLDANTDGSLQFYYSTTGSDVVSTLDTVTPVLSTATLYDIDIVRDGSDLKMYLDGVELAGISIATSIHNSVNNDCRIGLRYDNANPMHGEIGSVKLYRGLAITPTPPGEDFATYHILGF